MKLKDKRHTSIPVFVIFLFIALILFSGASILFYRASVNIFQITSFGSRLVFGLISAALSAGFILMLVVEKYSDSFLTRFLYILTSVWAGIFVYLFTATIIYDVFSFFIKSPRAIGLILFFTAIVISIYGLIHGGKIMVRKIKVSLPGLPKSWQGRTAVWMSDLHLGSIHGKKFSEKITKISNFLSPDIIFIGGDLYDGTHAPDPLLIAKPLEKLSSSFGTFFVTGNHEEFNDPSQFLNSIRALGIKVLENETVEIDGLQIVGVDYLTTSKKEDFQKILDAIKIDRTKPSILLKHEPINLDISEQKGISFQISGHTHKGQQWPFNYLTNLIAKGYGYGLKNYGTMQIYVSSGTGGWGPPLRVGSNREVVQIIFT